MTRPDPYDFESEKQHEISPGVVADNEIVCRAGFNPMHYAKGKPKNSIIRASDLISGSLSMWRGGTGNEDELASAVEQMTAPADQVIHGVFAPLAADIRDITLPNASRVFYVVDDCATDNDGGAHPLHAGVKICPMLNIESPDDDVFLQAKYQLLLVLKAAERPVPVAA